MLDQTDALQAALAGEHAALYAVGVAGGHLHGTRFGAAGQLHDRHRDRRDRLAGLLTAAGAEPVAAAAAYDLPSAVSTEAQAAALVRLVERRLATVYGDLVEAATDAKVRTVAVQALVATAREQALWGGTPTAFPGAAP
ncbi:MAG TPA: DUF4439 domain-containing protein [Kribbellaceae bacterium]|nr:DUF4439 domain-containing protein [Kribbellaceae bacterium]